MARRMIISFVNEDIHRPQPWPVGLDENPVPGFESVTHWVVSSGLGNDDGAVLVGFGPIHEQHISVLPEVAIDQPHLIEGLAATFSKDGGFFEWAIPVKELSVRD